MTEKRAGDWGLGAGEERRVKRAGLAEGGEPESIAGELQNAKCKLKIENLSKFSNCIFVTMSQRLEMKYYRETMTTS